MQTLWQDVRYGFRMLVKSPGFTLVAVLALGLGIGANTAIFSVFNGMLLRPMAVENPQQIVAVAARVRGLNFPGPLSYPDFQDYRQLRAVFSDLVAFSPSPVKFEAEGTTRARLAGGSSAGADSATGCRIAGV
jgi:putative ABC transport system permease protein